MNNLVDKIYTKEHIERINRKNNIIFPTGNDTLEVNDKIIVATSTLGIKGLNNILR